MKQDKINESILSTAQARGSEKTFCPSEIARELFPEDWRAHMQEIVEVAIVLQKQEKVLITKKGEAIDIDHIKGHNYIKVVKIPITFLSITPP